jgi:sodium transport system permease protein
MNKIFVVFRKEVIDNLRDQRSLLSLLLLPILYPALIGGSLHMTSKKVGGGSDKPIKLVVSGAQYAPQLIDYLKSRKVEITKQETGLRKLVKKGKANIAMRIPSDFAKRFRSAKPVKLELVLDMSRRWGKRHTRRVHQLLAAYGSHIGSLRLLVRGIHPTVVHPFAIQRVDVATQQGYSAMLLSSLPMLLILVVFMGGLYITVDSTAGEFERGSLEPLFINPIRRDHLLFGKYMASFLFSAIGLLRTCIGFGLVPSFISTKQLGFQLHLSPILMAQIFVYCIPLAFTATASQILLATHSKSFKEAQSKVSLFMLLPMIPGMFLIFTPVKPAMWAMLIPTLGEQILINAMIRGDVIHFSYFMVSAIATTMYAALFFFLASRLYTSERLFLRR